ncbi:hypothetical protein MVEN_00052300 [Mycena venus]|uniref:Uncharacterized protein n=1 Tax=Mycena venus TaxID=2733690 RepID=A0A8H6Z7C5_9AGAR|nr:hypothetical protein MVEN_00052300 [Mycena venus]
MSLCVCPSVTTESRSTRHSCLVSFLRPFKMTRRFKTAAVVYIVLTFDFGRARLGTSKLVQSTQFCREQLAR